MSSKFSSQGFDLDATTKGDDVILEVGGGATAVMDEEKKDAASTQKSEEYKADGNEQFKAGRYLDAYDCYTDAIEACPGMTGKELLSAQEEYEETERTKAYEQFRKLDEERRKQERETGKPAPRPPDSSQQAVPLYKAPPHEYGTQLSVYHCNRAATLLHMERYEEAVVDCNVAILLNPTYTKALVRRCTACEHLEKYEEALSDAQRAYELQPSAANKKTLQRMEKKQKEQLEKLKTETMGQLKELGNSLLGNFGLSMDNFNAVKDPNTGSYSISFNQGNQEK